MWNKKPRFRILSSLRVHEFQEKLRKGPKPVVPWWAAVAPKGKGRHIDICRGGGGGGGLLHLRVGDNFISVMFDELVLVRLRKKKPAV